MIHFKRGRLAHERHNTARRWTAARRWERRWMSLSIIASLAVAMLVWDVVWMHNRSATAYVVWTGITLAVWSGGVWEWSHWRTVRRTTTDWLLCLERLAPHHGRRNHPAAVVVSNATITRDVVRAALDAMNEPFCACHTADGAEVPITGDGSAEHPLMIDLGDPGTRSTTNGQEQ